MLTDRAKMHYQKRRKETIEKGLSPYDGHDTVGMIALDSERKWWLEHLQVVYL